MTRPGLDALGSLIGEDLCATPRAALGAALQAAESDPANRSTHLLDACYACLLAGEAKRALRYLEEIDPSIDRRRVHAIRGWAAQLDRNRYPGGVGAELPVDPALVTVTVQASGDETELIERIVGQGPPSISTPRAIVEGNMRSGAVVAARGVVANSLTQLQALFAFASQHALLELGYWAELAFADLAYRAGLTDQGRELVKAIRGRATSAGLVVPVVACGLLEGDWLATPGSSPEALGLDLAPQPGPSPMVSSRDLDHAHACYEAAASLASGLPYPAMHAAIDLRFAALGWLADDHPTHRARAQSALARSHQAGDSAGRLLAMTHLFLADLADGDIARHALELGSGLMPPVAGPISEMINWAKSDGSHAWTVGLGRLLQAAAKAWANANEMRRAQLAYLAALQLLSVEPAILSLTVVTAIAETEVAQNLNNSALIRMQRSLVSRSASPVGHEAALAERAEALMTMSSAYRGRARSGAVGAANALRRLRNEFEALLQSPELAFVSAVRFDDPDAAQAALARLTRADPDASLSDQLVSLKSGTGRSKMLEMLAGSVKGEIDAIDVIVPMTRADTARRAGEVTEADRLFAEAEAVARRPAVAAWLLPLLLLTDERRDEAREVLAERVANGSLPPVYAADLFLSAGDAAAASKAAFDASDGPRRSLTDWRDALTAADLALALGAGAEALDRVQQAVEQFEWLLSAVVRDTDRLALADQVTVARLFTIGARAAFACDDADRAFAYSERIRTLTADESQGATGTAQWGAWQRAAAEHRAIADRLVAAMDAGAADVPALLTGLDEADRALATAEIEVDAADPGILLRRLPKQRPRITQELRRQLPDGTVALEYLTVGRDFVGFAVTRDGVHTWETSVSSRQLDALIAAHHRQCADGRADAVESRQLSNLLLAPVADLLRDRDRVLISPLGSLNLVPFHALPMDDVPLGLTHIVSYLPRLGMIADSDRVLDDVAHIGRALIVGDPDFDAAARPRLHRLEGASVEAHAAAKVFGIDPHDVLVETGATEQAVRSRLSDRDLLMFATHGLLDAMSPFASSLVLAGTDELTVAELVGLHVGSRLAVLSACDTGRGTATLGGDLIGLTRALLRAGVRQAVVSLWPVDDEVAPITICRFLAEVQRGSPPASALAAAQRFVYGCCAGELSAEFERLGGRRHDLAGPSRRSRRRAPDLPPGLRDEEKIPAGLTGDAERYWAPFVLVGV
jgi:CHAT domain-containing protein